ncbi:MAG TPA: ATP-binding protein [Candidatus Limnocylindria bacterium]|nr:ATP-binding protein [Candidatus Limnocylindria bacterium]
MRGIDRADSAQLLGPTETARMVLYLSALSGAMILIVLYLAGLAVFQTNQYWITVAAPFIAEIVVVLAARTFLRRGRVVGATLTFVWGSLAAIVPFVVLFPAAYPASIIAVAQVEAVGLWFLRGRALIATLVGMTAAAGLVAAIGAALSPSGTSVEKASVALLVLLSFALLSVVLGLNQARLRRALSETENARDTLEERVEARTAELGQTARQLEAAKTAAEAATHAKSAFLANMSHELRTPLNSIIGFSDLVAEQLDAQLSDSQRRYLRNVRESGEHLLELINDVLDISKVEAGRLELRPEALRLTSLLDSVVASTRASADAAGLAFEAAEQDESIVRVDPARLRQILYNLLSNAVKFTPRGGTVRLRTRFEEDDLIVEVADTGFGIPATERHRVFGTFERLHEGRLEATGTGLGLALTKILVELHGGTIDFESEEGRGTTFRVVLPEARVEPIHGDRLLVVEDIKGDADLIVALAAEAGLRSEVVTTARAAIDAVRRDPPRGVVLDLRLPDERGERVLEALKTDPRTQEIPVIVVTVEDDEGRSRPLGADDHLTKPIDGRRLAAWLRQLRSVKEA